MGGITHEQSGLGYRQSLQAPAHVLGVTYTNTTGRPIFIMVGASQSGSGSQTFTLTLNGVARTVGYSVPYLGGYPSTSCSMVIPKDATYMVTVNGGLAFWSEITQ